MKAKTKREIGYFLANPLTPVAALFIIMPVFLAVLPIIPMGFRWPSLVIYVVALFTAGFSLRVLARKLINSRDKEDQTREG